MIFNPSDLDTLIFKKIIKSPDIKLWDLFKAEITQYIKTYNTTLGTPVINTHALSAHITNPEYLELIAYFRIQGLHMTPTDEHLVNQSTSIRQQFLQEQDTKGFKAFLNTKKETHTTETFHKIYTQITLTHQQPCTSISERIAHLFTRHTLTQSQTPLNNKDQILIIFFENLPQNIALSPYTTLLDSHMLSPFFSKSFKTLYDLISEKNFLEIMAAKEDLILNITAIKNEVFKKLSMKQEIFMELRAIALGQRTCSNKELGFTLRDIALRLIEKIDPVAIKQICQLEMLTCIENALNEKLISKSDPFKLLGGLYTLSKRVGFFVSGRGIEKDPIGCIFAKFYEKYYPSPLRLRLSVNSAKEHLIDTIKQQLDDLKTLEIPEDQKEPLHNLLVTILTNTRQQSDTFFDEIKTWKSSLARAFLNIVTAIGENNSDLANAYAGDGIKLAIPDALDRYNKITDHLRIIDLA